MSSELACRTVVPPARDESARDSVHRDGDDRLLALPSPLPERRGDISRGLAPPQRGCPSIRRQNAFATTPCFPPLPARERIKVRGSSLARSFEDRVLASRHHRIQVAR